MATAKQVKAAGPEDKGVKVTARPASFRRAGYSFTAEPTVIPLSELTPDQLDQLEGDTNLVCQRVDIELPAAEKK